jgi:hypothetical protein
MRFPGTRKFAAIAVPFALAAGALVFTAIPAQAIRNCTPTKRCSPRRRSPRMTAMAGCTRKRN